MWVTPAAAVSRKPLKCPSKVRERSMAAIKITEEDRISGLSVLKRSKADRDQRWRVAAAHGPEPHRYPF